MTWMYEYEYAQWKSWWMKHWSNVQVLADLLNWMLKSFLYCSG